MDSPLIIADDLQLFRQGLRDLLTLEGCAIVAEASDGIEAVRLTADHPEAILLLDIRLPGMDGFEVLAELKARHLPNRVVMLTAHWTNELLFRALVAGAVGYVAKDCETVELTAAIAMVAQGGIALSSAVVTDFEAGIEITQGVIAEREARALGLSEREREVLALLPGALSLTQIAAGMFVSRKTVQNNASTLYRKLGVSSRSEAVLEAVRLRLVAGPATSQRPRSLHGSRS